MGAKKIVAIALVFLFSVPVPLGIVAWSTVSSFSGKLLTHPGSEINEIWGSLKNGEMWFPVSRYSHTTPPLLIDCRIKRLNLETGAVSDANVAPAKAFVQPFWLGEELYGYNQRTLFKCVDSKFVELALLPPRVPRYFFTRPFLHDGQITTIVNPSTGVYRLVHLVDGEWIDGRTVNLPLPPGAKAVDERNAPSATGVEFADPNDEPRADNADQPGTSNISIRPAFIDDRTSFELRFGPEDMYYVHISWPLKLARQGKDGRWIELTGDYGRSTHHWHHPFILADPAEPNAYLIEPEPYGAYADVHRIEGDRVLPSHVHWSGNVEEYLGHWRRFSIGLLAGWFLHLAVLIAGIHWFAPRDSSLRFEFGSLQANSASIWRRGLAVACDLLLTLAVLAALILAELPIFGIRTQPFTNEVLFDLLFDIERDVARGIENGVTVNTAARIPLSFVGSILSTAESLLEFPGPLDPTLLLLVIGEVVILAVIKLEVEGRFGITVGKWLLGVRTVRSTLRPCGFARALTRNVLYWIDIPFFLTPFPAAISMMLSNRRQRLGDRVADTVVVRTGSIRPRVNEDDRSHRSSPQRGDGI